MGMDVPVAKTVQSDEQKDDKGSEGVPGMNEMYQM